MTQALNLANFANNLNPSGQTSNSGLQNSSVTVTAGTGMSGGGAVALGSSVTLTNAGVTSILAGTGISVSSATGAVTITNNATSSYVGILGQIFTSSGTFTVPAGVTAVKVTLCGGGGGDSGNYVNGVTGGTSSFGAYISASGGVGGTDGSGGGGTGANGTLTSAQMALTFGSLLSPTFYVYGLGAVSGGYGGGGGGSSPIGTKYITGLSGSVTVTVGAGGHPGDSYNYGNAGIVIVEW